MIDVHSHLLPGVDDGSPSVEVSVPVLDDFVRCGVETLVCTPHLDASRAGEAPWDRHVEILGTLRAAAPAGIRLELGWEIMLDVPGADLRAPHLALAGSNAVLVEFPRAAVPPNATEELFRLRMSGIVPVLAHPERYRGCSPESVTAWKRSGAVIQVDVQALHGTGRSHLAAVALLQAGLVDLFASDNHGDTRSLESGRNWLRDHATAEHVELLTRRNAEALLAGRPLHPVPPLPRPRPGLMDRVRGLFGGRH